MIGKLLWSGMFRDNPPVFAEYGHTTAAGDWYVWLTEGEYAPITVAPVGELPENLQPKEEIEMDLKLLLLSGYVTPGRVLLSGYATSERETGEHFYLGDKRLRYSFSLQAVGETEEGGGVIGRSITSSMWGEVLLAEEVEMGGKRWYNIGVRGQDGCVRYVAAGDGFGEYGIHVGDELSMYKVAVFGKIKRKEEGA